MNKLKSITTIFLALIISAAVFLSCSYDSGQTGQSTISSGDATQANTDGLGQDTPIYSPPEGSEGTQWYELSNIVAHALGSVDGRCESNSVEAFLASYARGQRVFEVDLNFTSDNVLVARHDFEQDSYYTLEQSVPESGTLMNLETFLATPIMGIYTPADISTLAGWLSDYDDIWLITDTKETDENIIRAQFTQLRDTLNSDERLDRVVVQFYNMEMYKIVNEIYPFKNYIFTVYQLDERDFNVIGRFCAENNIAVVTMPSSTADVAVTEILHSYGLRVFTHTVNRITTMKTMILYGMCDGFYSDYVTEPELSTYLKK